MAPNEEYFQRLKEREARAARYDGLHLRLGYLKLLLLGAGLLFAWLDFGRGIMPAWPFAIAVALFVAASLYHSRLLRNKSLAERSAQFYRQGLARLEDRWRGHGSHGERFQNPHHVYASDLDLFGAGGLFELLSTARTRMGEQTLARWLLSPAAMPEVLSRQQAVMELRDRLDLREEIFLIGTGERTGVHSRTLRQWAESRCDFPPWLRIIAPLLAFLVVASAALWLQTGFAAPAVSLLAIEAAILYRYRQRLERILHETEHAFEDLGLLSSLLARLESERFASERLKQLSSELESHHIPGSRAIRRLETIVDFIHSSDNLLIRVLNLPLLYSLQVAFAAEGWRREHGQAVGRWLKAIGEIEALLSLANYSYEHPQDSFPEFTVEGPQFIAEDLGHPLIPAATCVRNDLSLDAETRVLFISGSNMSGKSTLLRAVGVNIVLAMAGAPVRARRLQLAAVQVGASIRINDSLQEGSSRFQAEITRLRQIFDLATRGMPVLFLLDELLQGTNSKDRRIGAEGILRALVQRNDIGLVTTHDLALTEIADALPGKLKNVHFQEEIEQGVMRFDYRLRPGIVEKSNGLELMRMMGLDV